MFGLSKSVLSLEVNSVFFREELADLQFFILVDFRLNKVPLGCRTGGVHTNIKSRSRSRVFLAVLKLGGVSCN